MAENGTVFSAGTGGGFIDAEPPSPVHYDASAVRGPTPRDEQLVWFNRAVGDNTVAAWVSTTPPGATDLAASLEDTFHTAFGARPLSDGAKAEIARLAADRAGRILRPAASDTPASDAVVAARLALANTAMTLLAVEAEGDDVTCEQLRGILRQQRPSLPR